MHMHINLYFSQNVLDGISSNAAGSFTGYIMSKYQGKKIQDMIKGDPPTHTHILKRQSKYKNPPWQDLGMIRQGI